VVFVLVAALALGAAAVWRGRPAASVRAEEPVPAAPVDSPSPVISNPAPSAQPRPFADIPIAPVIGPSAKGQTDEPASMARLRWLKETDPALSLELAREANRSFPDSADASERASIVIHALASLGRASEARGEAEEMVNHYPDSEWVREIERFTGAHRHRNFRLADDGSIESY
jgi:hypothetical protein